MKNVLPFVLLVAFFPLLGQKGNQAKPYFPPAGVGAEKSPSLVGVDAALLQEAVDFAVASESKPLKERDPAMGFIINALPCAPLSAFYHLGAGTSRV